MGHKGETEVLEVSIEMETWETSKTTLWKTQSLTPAEHKAVTRKVVSAKKCMVFIVNNKNEEDSLSIEKKKEKRDKIALISLVVTIFGCIIGLIALL